VDWSRLFRRKQVDHTSESATDAYARARELLAARKTDAQTAERRKAAERKTEIEAARQRYQMEKEEAARAEAQERFAALPTELGYAASKGQNEIRIMDVPAAANSLHHFKGKCPRDRMLITCKYRDWAGNNSSTDFCVKLAGWAAFYADLCRKSRIPLKVRVYDATDWRRDDVGHFDRVGVEIVIPLDQ
jgi:hypothetical protein